MRFSERTCSCSLSCICSALLPYTTAALLCNCMCAVQKNRIGLKGPMMTPIGKGFRSLNLTLRKELQVPRRKPTVHRQQVLVACPHLALQRGCAGVLVGPCFSRRLKQ